MITGKHIWSASADKTIRIWTVTHADKTIAQADKTITPADKTIASADKTIRTVTPDDAAAGSRAAGGRFEDGGAVGGGRKCMQVIARQEATWRPGCLVPMVT